MPYRTWPKSTFSMYEGVAQTLDLTLSVVLFVHGQPANEPLQCPWPYTARQLHATAFPLEHRKVHWRQRLQAWDKAERVPQHWHSQQCDARLHTRSRVGSSNDRLLLSRHRLIPGMSAPSMRGPCVGFFVSAQSSFRSQWFTVLQRYPVPLFIRLTPSVHLTNVRHHRYNHRCHC